MKRDFAIVCHTRHIYLYEKYILFSSALAFFLLARDIFIRSTVINDNGVQCFGIGWSVQRGNF